MASQVCCKPTAECVREDDGTCTFTNKCILKTDEGDVECECICKCECGASKTCTCECKCTPETAQKIQTAEGVKYRCECKCKC